MPPDAPVTSTRVMLPPIVPRYRAGSRRRPAEMSFQQRVILGQLACVPDRQLVTQCGLADLGFRDRLYFLVVHQQTVHVQELLAGRVARLELDRTALLGVLH